MYILLHMQVAGVGFHLYVCLFFRMISQKRMQPGLPNLIKFSTVSRGNLFIFGVRISNFKVIVTKSCWHGSLHS